MPDAVRILGLDLSYTATGVSRPDGANELIKTKPIEGQFGKVTRCIYIAKTVREHVRQSGATHVVCEGGVSRSFAAWDSGALHGVVKSMLLEADIPWIDIAPASLKKFATDNGQCSKDAMIAAAIRAFGFEGSDNNLADALILRRMGEQSISGGDTAYRRKAIAKVVWPWDCAGDPA